MGTLSILDSIESTSSRKEKVAILKANWDRKSLQKLLWYANNPYLTFGIGTLQMFIGGLPTIKTDSGQRRSWYYRRFLDLLEKLSGRALTGGRAKSAVEDFFNSGLTVLEHKWYSRVLLKDLRIGLTTTSINQVWPGFIPHFGVQLANLLKPETDVRYPVLVDPKIDGLRLVAIKRSGKVKLYTRNGHEVETLPEIVEELTRADYDDVVLDGEAQGADWNESQSVIASTKRKLDSSGMILHVFDALMVESWDAGSCPFPMSERREHAANVVRGLSRVVDVPVEVAHSQKDIDLAFQRYLKAGYEGAMVKDPKAKYDFKRSNAVLKVKPFESSEGTVVGWEYGQGKRADGIGALVVSIDGVESRVGSGFTDADLRRMNEDPDGLIGKVAEVKYQQLTKDGKARHPVFLRFIEET
jgi:DNA ligase-1